MVSGVALDYCDQWPSWVAPRHMLSCIRTNHYSTQIKIKEKKIVDVQRTWKESRSTNKRKL